jgi:hypothetical protein
MDTIPTRHDTTGTDADPWARRAERANLAAEFTPADPSDPHTLPTVTIADVAVAVYLDPRTRRLRVSVHADSAQPWLTTGPQDEVPVEFAIDAQPVHTT